MRYYKKSRLPKRLALIIKLRQEGLTYQEIGEKFNISRERVRQIGKGHPDQAVRSLFIRPASVVVSKPCGVCGKIMTGCRSVMKKKKFCSRVCFATTQRKYPTLRERDLAKNARHRARYARDPAYRAQISRAMKRWLEKKERLHPEYRTIRLARMRKYKKRPSLLPTGEGENNPNTQPATPLGNFSSVPPRSF